MEANEIVPGRDLNKLDTEIVRLRTEQPNISYEKLAEKLDDTPGHIAGRVRKLIKDGEIEPRGGPGYRSRKGE